MRACISRMLWAAVPIAICACAGTSAQRDHSEPSGSERSPEAHPHYDLAYSQFILHADGNAPEVYNLSSLQDVPAECGASGVVPKAGGVAILASLGKTLTDKMESVIKSEIGKLVNAEIARYSSDVVGKPARFGFYAPQLWFTKPGSADRYSCFIIAMNKCEAAKLDKERGVCASDSDAETRVLIVGQYKLSREDLQVRPLFGQVKGFEAKRNPAQREARIAATLKFESVWWDGHQGRIEAPLVATVLSLKFEPTPGDAADPGIDLVVKHKDPNAAGRYEFAQWSSLPLLPRPALTTASEGTVSITPAVAETNAPPVVLELIGKLAGEDAEKVSPALKSAAADPHPAE